MKKKKLRERERERETFFVWKIYAKTEREWQIYSKRLGIKIVKIKEEKWAK